MPFLYHANEVLKRKKLFKRRRDFQFALVGSLMTDLEWVADLKGAHEKSLPFYYYLLQKDKKYAPFALGMHIHAETDGYIEPSYVDSQETVALVTEILKKHDPGKLDLENAHHVLVEQAIDYHLATQNKKLIPALRRALKRFYKEHHFLAITEHMEDFFGTQKKEILREKLLLLNPQQKRPIVDLDDFTNLHGQVKLWIGNTFYWIHSKTIVQMYQTTLMLRFTWFWYWQDKKKLHHMIEEALGKLNTFHPIILGFQDKLDRYLEPQLRLLHQDRHSLLGTVGTESSRSSPSSPFSEYSSDRSKEL